MGYLKDVMWFALLYKRTSQSVCIVHTESRAFRYKGTFCLLGKFIRIAEKVMRVVLYPYVWKVTDGLAMQRRAQPSQRARMIPGIWCCWWLRVTLANQPCAQPYVPFRLSIPAGVIPTVFAEQLALGTKAYHFLGCWKLYSMNVPKQTRKPSPFLQ